MATAALCSASTFAGGSSCCVPNGGLGCDDPTCQEAVCSIDSFCCVTAWDTICANEAASLCGDLCAGSGGGCGDSTNDCCVAGFGPGCSDVDCCNAVCAADSFCCAVEWDALCAQGAATLCLDLCGLECDLTCPSGSVTEAEACGADTNGGCNAPPIGSSTCCIANGGLGCDDPTCQDLVCAIDSFCCVTAWDGICAGEAASLCGDLCASAAAYESISCGDTVCGTFWADGSFRDTDWYTFDVAAASNVTWSVKAAIPATIALLDSNCPPFVFVIQTASGCPSEVTWCLEAGTYTAFVAPGVFAGVPCGTGDANNYVATLTCGETCEPLACGSNAAGDCCVAGSAPFCNDADCCNAVCAADSFCCAVAWDGLCAQAAATLCLDLCGIECDLTCPSGSSNEAEACGADTNGGCNAPPVGGSSCCIANGGLGCDDPTCQDLVCAIDSFCCVTQWDGICAGEAASLCGDLCAIAAAYESISCGDTVCGTFWADGSFRDTDWYTFDLANTATVTWSVKSVIPVTIALLDDQCPPGVSVIATASGCPAEVSFCLDAGTHTAFVAPGVFSGIPCGLGEANNYVATLTCGSSCSTTAENDECANAIAVVEGGNPVSNVFATGSQDVGPTCEKGFGTIINNDVWYTYVATGTGTTTVSLCDSVNFDSRLAVFTGPCDALVLVACNDDGAGCSGFTSELSFEAVCDTSYTIVMGSFDPAVTGSGTMNITQAGECGTPCVGDLDNDGDVDAADLALLLGGWGTAGASDLNGSGNTDAADLAILLGAWGTCP